MLKQRVCILPRHFLPPGSTYFNMRDSKKGRYSQLALWKERGHALMKSGDSFIQEMACLHGISEHPRHPGILETALDRCEELAFDATTPIDTY